MRAGPGFPALSPSKPGDLTRIDVRHFASRPRLAVVIREGDPAPAVALAVHTATAPATTVAVASLVEHRVTRAGFAVDLRVDRMAFRLVWWPARQEQTESFVRALAAAFATPVAADGPLFAHVQARLSALRRNPL
ncbi:MAG: hypothetical protein JRI23_36005, partial [Deltaproteobacteria bacterium]|nr:hypothetical protein [Deltaproteobacteria bacterium]